MQLKRLEISGFKSFADRCAIDFPPGISAIVGPNGCGKSNIIDAIKWVMGEQSVKQLRGKSMGDVIFAGTGKRHPLNMAEVSLVVAGHDGSAVGSIGAYTEIMITRRLYRSGESQYLINRQPCRLKDISDIFLRYSVGARSCAIIQQGNIGAITDATPEERRAFIEEAAGVVRYKARRQEAISKVNATRENLTRLNDILEEIDNRLSELFAAAEKAKQYRDCRDRLKKTDTLVTVYYHQHYTRKIESIRDLLNRLNEKTAYQSEELESLQSALQEIESYRQEKTRQIEAKKAEKEEKQRATEKREYALMQLKADASSIAGENERLERSLEELSGKNIETQKELTEEQDKRGGLQNRIDSVKTKIDDENQAAERYKEQLAEQDQLLDEKKELLMELSSQHARYQNISQNAAANKEDLARRIKRIEDETATTAREIQTLSARESETRRRFEELNTHLDALARQKSECEETLKTKNTALAEKIKAVSEHENNRSRLKSRLGVLKKMETNFEWYKDGVKAIMKNRRQIDDPDRIRGIAAEIMEPAEGFEHAVEAALGESLQYIIVNGQDAGIDYINYLREENAGRSGFISMDTLPPAPSAAEGIENDISKDDMEAGMAGSSRPKMLAAHVNAIPGFESVIHAMLSGIAVVDDLKAAVAMQRSGSRIKKIVTRQGDVLSEGILVGGSRDKLAGILEKRREIKQIQNDMDRLDEIIDTEKKIRAELEDEVKSLENRLSDINQKKFKQEGDRLEAEKSLYQISEQLKHANRHMEISLLEKERLAGEKEDISAQIDQHEQALAELTDDIEFEKSEIDNITGQIETLKESVKTFDNRLVDLKLAHTRLSAELENTARTLARLESFKKEGLKRAEELQKNLETGRQKEKETGDRIVSTEAALAEASASLDQLKNSLREEESDYQAIIDKKSDTDHRLSETKTTLEKAREKIHKLELELSGLQINRENLVNRFLERYPDPFSPVLSEYGGMVEAADFSIEKTEKERADIRVGMEELGDVNLGAIDAYEAQKTRRDFLLSQRRDLEDALTDLENVIKKINRITRNLFTRTFEAVNEKFRDLFPRLFNGGAAWLELTRPDLPLETGVELMIQPPGKNLSRLSLLSGGEKALSAIAFIFSIFMLNPASFCLLDEIDAPLDDANVYRFNELLRIIGAETQIIMISHKKKTMEFSDILFGITEAKSGGSLMISVNIDQAIEIKEKPTLTAS